MWRLDWAQGLGPRRRRNTPWSLEWGQRPAWPPTHRSLASLAVQPKPGTTHGTGPSPQSGLAPAFLTSRGPAPKSTSPSTGVKPNFGASSTQSPAEPSPLLFTRRTSGWQKPDLVSPQLQTLPLSPHSAPRTCSCSGLTYPGSFKEQHLRRATHCPGPRGLATPTQQAAPTGQAPGHLLAFVCALLLSGTAPRSPRVPHPTTDHHVLW